MPVVRLGNTRAIDAVRLTEIPGNRITEAIVPSSYTRQEMLRTVTHPDGLWSNHSAAAAPAWVESDDPELARDISDIYGCPIGRPADWEVCEG